MAKDFIPLGDVAACDVAVIDIRCGQSRPARVASLIAESFTATTDLASWPALHSAFSPHATSDRLSVIIGSTARDSAR